MELLYTTFIFPHRLYCIECWVAAPKSRLTKVVTSDVTIHDTIVYRDTLGYGTIHSTLSLCTVSSRYILKLSLMYENSYRIVKLFANTPN